MKTSKLLLFLSGSVGLMAFSGCDTTPQARISEHPDQFAQLTPQQQQQVRSGQVAIGMDMDAVKLALGDPDAVTNRTNAEGISQVWHYLTYGYYDGTYLYGGPYWGAHGRRRWGGSWGWDAGFSAYPGPVTTYPRYRIVFANGKVTAIEQDVPVSG